MGLSDSNQSILSGPRAAESQAMILDNETFIGFGSIQPAAGEAAAVGIYNDPAGNPDDSNPQDLFVFNITASVANTASQIIMRHNKIIDFLTVNGTSLGENMSLKTDKTNRAGRVMQFSSPLANLIGSGQMIDFLIPGSLASLSIPFKGLFKIAPGVTLYLHDSVADRRIRASFQWFETERIPE